MRRNRHHISRNVIYAPEIWLSSNTRTLFTVIMLTQVLPMGQVLDSNQCRCHGEHVFKKSDRVHAVPLNSCEPEPGFNSCHLWSGCKWRILLPHPTDPRRLYISGKRRKKLILSIKKTQHLKDVSLNTPEFEGSDYYVKTYGCLNKKDMQYHPELVQQDFFFFLLVELTHQSSQQCKDYIRLYFQKQQCYNVHYSATRRQKNLCRQQTVNNSSV